MMNDSISTLAVTMIEDNVIVRAAYLSRAPKTCLFWEPDLIWFTNDIAYPNPHFNIVLQTDFTSAQDAVENIQHVHRYAQRRGLPMFWLFNPWNREQGMGMSWSDYGLTFKAALQGMALNLNDLYEDIPAPKELTIIPVRNATQLEQFIAVLATNSNLPRGIAQEWFHRNVDLGFDEYNPRQRYLGLWDGQPVATASLFMSPGVAGLYEVATLPDMRGHGIAAAMSLATMREGRQRDGHWGVLMSTPVAVNIYPKLGFKPMGVFDLYVWNPE